MIKYFLTILTISLNSQAALLKTEKALTKIYKNSSPSVVNITNIQTVGHPFFGQLEKIPAGQGSAFVWDKEGHIVTNYHVVQGGENFQVSFYGDKKTYEAKIMGVSPRKDIAVLKVVNSPKEIAPIVKGSSKELKVGQYAIAIGNPFGLDHSMSVGIISALGRKIEGIGDVTINNMIQTDAAINQGNSGGPLMNSEGQLIGMNTMIYSPTGTNAGLGFAVPADTINRIVPQLIEFGKIIRPSLGIHLLDDNVKKRFFGNKGIAILEVSSGGPADKAGVQGLKRGRRGRLYKGDLILKINEDEVNSYDDIYHVLEKYKIGEKVSITIRRDTKIKKIDLTLEAL